MYVLWVGAGPMLLGMSQVVFEGVPTYPDASRAWAITDKYKVRTRTALLYFPPLLCPAPSCPAVRLMLCTTPVLAVHVTPTYIGAQPSLLEQGIHMRETGHYVDRPKGGGL